MREKVEKQDEALLSEGIIRQLRNTV